MQEARNKLAEARIALRDAKDHLETTKAIALLNVGGKNDDERKRLAAALLAEHDGYQDALTTVRNHEADIERLEAEIATWEDAIRLRELEARERLNEALLGRRVDNVVADAVIDQATQRNGYQYGRTAEDVHWDQHMGHQEPLYNDWEKQG